MEVCPEPSLLVTPTKLACHNICNKTNGLMCIEHLLRLGVNYFERKTNLRKKTIDDLMYTLRNKLRWKYIYHDKKNYDDSYIP